MFNFYEMLKTAGADIPVRWDLFPPMSQQYIWREVYMTCFITLRRLSSAAADEFSMLDIAHQAAIVVDHCLVRETSFLGGQTIVGPRGEFYLEVANLPIIEDVHSASRNASATSA